MKSIQPQQMRTIYAISRSLGIDNEELHCLVEGVTGLASIKALSEAQAEMVVAELKTRQKAQGIAPRAKSTAPKASRPGGITSRQQAKVWALIGELEKLGTGPAKGTHRDRLCGVIKKELGMDAPPSNPFAWVTMKQGIQLIDALKRYVEHEAKKYSKRGCVASG